jgi:hypothetical protein
MDTAILATERAVLAIVPADRDALAAYQFSPGSYTYSAHLECAKARDAIVTADEILCRPLWVGHYLDYEDERPVIAEPSGCVVTEEPSAILPTHGRQY